MIRRHFLISFTIGVLLVMTTGAAVSAAVNCGEPVAAPKWEIGDTWTVQDEQGEERTETVVGFEGKLVRLEWSYTDRNVVLLVDSDLVLRKVITADGMVLERPGRNEWNWIGIRVLHFPLHGGKTWTFRFDRDGTAYWMLYRVLACEKTSIIAGEFSALKLEATMKLAHGRWEGIIHEWFAPAAKRIVRRTYQRPNFADSTQDWEVLRYRK